MIGSLSTAAVVTVPETHYDVDPRPLVELGVLDVAGAVCIIDNVLRYHRSRWADWERQYHLVADEAARDAAIDRLLERGLLDLEQSGTVIRLTAAGHAAWQAAHDAEEVLAQDHGLDRTYRRAVAAAAAEALGSPYQPPRVSHTVTERTIRSSHGQAETAAADWRCSCGAGGHANDYDGVSAERETHQEALAHVAHESSS